MEKLEAKLKAVDWAVRDVLVGTMRSPQQLDICRKHCFYYIPAERLQDSDFPIRYVALYQSQYVFGAQAVPGKISERHASFMSKRASGTTAKS